MPPLARIPSEFLDAPFRRDEAIRAGLTDNVLRGPQFRRPFPGVRIPCTLPDTIKVRCAAAALILPGEAAFSHETAIELCALPLPRHPAKEQDGETSRPETDHEQRSQAPRPIHVIVPPGHVVPHIDGIVSHTGLDPADVVEVDGLRVVAPGRTFFHLAPSLTVTELVVLGDAIVRHWTAREELVGRAAGMSRRRGIVRAREAVGLVCAGVDSPMETRVRLLLVRAGLPCPAVNRDVYDAAGGWLARPDLSYPALKIAIEYDGDHHRTDRKQWRRDRARDANLREAGWIVITLTADDVFRYPDRTVATVWRHYRTRSDLAPAA